ncbi:unnamed protein product [Owenia fusiformis]|uniref:Lysosomal dipeptide transporter MFSD1 n=1 Tax=Owenia fusiformis TaxID=6347 RepID=A0A8S4NJL1_OWEFU|nr:unnamed protein product [Owenia fusiformis]
MTEEEKSPLLANSAINTDNEDVELHGCGGTLCCNPKRNVHRYPVLVIMCFLSFGSYFCYDNPAAMQDIMLRDLSISTETFMNFYAWYSWPNVILCFFGGFLIDRVFGIRWGAIIFSAFVTVGQVLFALGAFINSIPLMDAGRFVFGIGGESLAVAQNTYAVAWFKDRELNMVFGLQLSFSRVGSTVNMNIMQPVYRWAATAFGHGQSHTTLGIVLMLAVGTCIISLICALSLGYLDRRASKILNRDAGKTGEVIKITDVKDFPASFWLICVICVAYYVTVFPFIGLGLVFFESKFGMEPGAAGAVNSIVYILSAVVSPICGLLVDKTGLNIFWVIVGVVTTAGCHACMAFTFINPYVPMVTMGVAYSILASALWPMVAFIVPEHQLGTAYGIMQAIQNLGLAVIAIVAGDIVDAKGYLLLEVFFMAWLFVALIASVVLYILDQTQGVKLNRS